MITNLELSVMLAGALLLLTILFLALAFNKPPHQGSARTTPWLCKNDKNKIKLWWRRRGLIVSSVIGVLVFQRFWGFILGGVLYYFVFRWKTIKEGVKFWQGVFYSKKIKK